LPIKVPQGTNNLIQWLKWLEAYKDTCKKKQKKTKTYSVSFVISSLQALLLLAPTAAADVDGIHVVTWSSVEPLVATLSHRFPPSCFGAKTYLVFVAYHDLFFTFRPREEIKFA